MQLTLVQCKTMSSFKLVSNYLTSIVLTVHIYIFSSKIALFAVIAVIALADAYPRLVLIDDEYRKLKNRLLNI